jgi:hypothetical protein
MEHNAVSVDFWKSICPQKKRHIINSRDQPWNTEGDVLMDWWIKRLSDVDEPCVEISAYPTLFDF